MFAVSLIHIILTKGNWGFSQLHTCPNVSVEMSSDGDTASKPKTAAAAPSGSGPIQVSSLQRGNPVLKHIRSVPWEFSDTVTAADYVVGKRAGIVFLSVRYHTLHPGN